MNAEVVDYVRISGETLVDVTVSPIKRRSITLLPEVSQLDVDRQWFGINVEDLDSKPPVRGDKIVMKNMEDHVFEVVPEDENSPVYDFTTTKRDRFLVHTQKVESPELLE